MRGVSAALPCYTGQQPGGTIVDDQVQDRAVWKGNPERTYLGANSAVLDDALSHCASDVRALRADYAPPLTLAHVSRRETVRLNTGLPGRESASRTK